MKKMLCSLAGVMALGLSVQANAVPVTFSIDAANSWATPSSGSGVTIALNPHLGSESALLSAGQRWAFDFFSITVPWFSSGEGRVSASLAFDEPSSAPNATGAGRGEYWNFLITGGELTWIRQPGLFSLADGTVYSVLFENLHGITVGKTVDVRAYLTLHTEPVPAPGTLALLGLGMLGVILASRRQLAAARKA